MENNNNPDLFHEILSSIREVISEVKLDLKEIKGDIAEIKMDVNHHILRTDLLQDSQDEQKKKIEQLEKEAATLRDQKAQKEVVDQLLKDSWKLKGALAFFGLILTILGTYALFKH